ncbi:hypothetical protein [Catenulispora rubra]|uniref:hypothetical protein n=1 Tax=Catenulispora rubra TaxID=280293 RepID=UPI0018923A96|nr:hypothetical protein [Catenulispora rubra]
MTAKVTGFATDVRVPRRLRGWPPSSWQLNQDERSVRVCTLGRDGVQERTQKLHQDARTVAGRGLGAEGGTELGHEGWRFAGEVWAP